MLSGGTSERPLTEKQYERLRSLASGSMLISGGTKRDWESMLARGFVTGELGAQGCYVNGVRITALGLRALADAVERYGLPEMMPRPDRRPRRICRACGCSSFRWETREEIAP